MNRYCVKLILLDTNEWVLRENNGTKRIIFNFYFILYLIWKIPYRL